MLAAGKRGKGKATTSDDPSGGKAKEKEEPTPSSFFDYLRDKRPASTPSRVV